MTAGLSTKSQVGQVLWRVSRIVGGTPFDENLTRLNRAQLDFILEMYALDNPDSATFVRAGQPSKKPQSEILAAWDKVLLGRAKQEFLFKRAGGAMIEKLKEYLDSPSSKRVAGFMKQRVKGK